MKYTSVVRIEPTKWMISLKETNIRLDGNLLLIEVEMLV